MSVLEEVLEEEYQRSKRLSQALEAELAELPRGSVRERKINNRIYYYLQYREGKQVKSDYVPREKVDEVRRLVARRKDILVAIKEQERSRKQIEKALGKEFADEHAEA